MLQPVAIAIKLRLPVINIMLVCQDDPVQKSHCSVIALFQRIARLRDAIKEYLGNATFTYQHRLVTCHSTAKTRRMHRYYHCKNAGLGKCTVPIMSIMCSNNHLSMN